MLAEGAELLEKTQGTNIVERTVVDEAHTICSWGNTFRPVYKAVAENPSKLKCAKLLLSAMVPEVHQLSLQEMFGNVTILRDSVFRENLFVEVKERPTKFYDEPTCFIREKGKGGIVYCVFPDDVSKIQAELVKRNIICVKYHDQLSLAVREASFAKWSSGEVDVIVANSAFGMGIDKSDVRYVVHAKLRTSIDDYFQQEGQAVMGTQQPATCTTVELIALR